MIVDASAVIAIVLGEPDAESFGAALSAPGRNRMSSVNFLEAAVRIDGLRVQALANEFDDLMRRSGIEVVSASAHHANLAREAYHRFGKGSRHGAKLNFGDCFAYALATDSGEPLLFKGSDFARTDIKSVL